MAPALYQILPSPLIPLKPIHKKTTKAATTISLALKISRIRSSTNEEAHSNNNNKNSGIKVTCKNCKTQFDPALNHPRACLFHTAHFGGETKRKFESVYAGGTMDTPDSGRVFQYWHCCGSEDPFDPGCTAAPHLSYDD